MAPQAGAWKVVALHARTGLLQRSLEFLRLLDAIGPLDMDDQKGRGIQRLLGQAVQRIVAARPAES